MARTTAGLGREIYKLRRHQGITQAELARRAGVSRDWLIRLEQGHDRLEVGKVFAVLDTLGVEAVLSPRAETESPELDALFANLTAQDEPS